MAIQSYWIPLATTSRNAASAELSPVTDTEPPRVHAHSARSCAGAVTVTSGCPAEARTARGWFVPAGTPTWGISRR